MKKQSSVLAVAAGAHIAQNVLGSRLVKSVGFKQNTAKSFLSGATARVGRSGTLAETAKSMGYGVAAPEAVIAQNRAYESGQKVYRKLRTNGVDINKMSKRDLALARMELRGKHSTVDYHLKKKGVNNPLINTLRSQVSPGIRQNITRENTHSSHLKEVLNKPMGNKLPHSGKAVATANVAAAAVEPVAGAFNGAKYALESKAVAKTRFGKWADKKFVSDPLKNAYEQGRKGIERNSLKDAAHKYLVNGAVGEGIQGAHKAGLQARSDALAASARQLKAPKKV